MEGEECEFCKVIREARPIYRDKTCTVMKSKNEYIVVLGHHGKATAAERRLMTVTVNYLFDGGQTTKIEEEHEHWLVAGARYIGGR